MVVGCGVGAADDVVMLSSDVFRVEEDEHSLSSSDSSLAIFSFKRSMYRLQKSLHNS